MFCHAFSDDEAGREPAPAEAAAFAELLERCLATLPNGPDLPLRRIAALLLEGRSRAEIAAALGCLEADVKRYEAMIHARWRRIIEPQISPSVGSTRNP